MSFLDFSKDDKDFEELSCSVCVIGSGPAGGIVAAQLARKNVDVILLEAGAKLPNYSIDNIAETNLHSDVTNLRYGWSQQYGGSSNLWAGRVSPFEPIDMSQRQWVPESGWPVSFNELNSHYMKAADILNIIDYENFYRYNDSCSQNCLDFIKNEDTDLEYKKFQWITPPFQVSQYLDQIIKQGFPLRIALNAPVRSLQENPNGSSVLHAEVLKPDRDTIRINADYFVLAAGGIETPRLLLNSTNVRACGIGNDHDVVGRYFSTHPKADIAVLMLNKPVSTSHALFMDKPLDRGYCRYGIGFSEVAQQSLQLLNHYVQASPLLEFKANQAFEILQKNKILNDSLIDRSKIMQGVLPGIGKIIYELIGRAGRFQPKTKKFILRGFLDQFPNRENRVGLSSSQREDGTYKAIIHWRFSDADKNSVIRFLTHLDNVFKKQNIGRVEYSKLANTKDWPLTGIHSHFMGTTRMGDNPKTSVTDKNARVHNSDNLYIAGPSLFPTYGYANPFLTIVALSNRLAEHLLSRIH